MVMTSPAPNQPGWPGASVTWRAASTVSKAATTAPLSSLIRSSPGQAPARRALMSGR
jgi:hypothetical protein